MSLAKRAWLCRVGMALALLSALLLVAACTTGFGAGLPARPVMAANQTVIDEQAMITVEQSYLTIGGVIEAATDAGLLKGQAAARVNRLDGLAMDAVIAMRMAYDTGNAASFTEALTRARATIEQIRTVIGGTGSASPEALP